MGKRSRRAKREASPRKDSTGLMAARVRAALNGNTFWVLVFVLTVGVTQIGSLEREVIDWDESVFILIAANVLDGHLPYVELFDNKPPMIFFMLAGVMAVFGESLLVVRLFGDVCILASCVAVFAIARRWTDPISAGLGTLTVIAVSSADSFGQHTSSELPATALLMAALWLLLARRDRLWAVACAGLLVSLATLTRSNLGVAAVAFAGWLLVAYVRPSFGAHRWALAAFVGAGAIPPGLLVLVYWAADALFELRVSIIDTPLAYAGNQLSVLEALEQHTNDWWRLATQLDPYLIGTYTVLTAGGLMWVSVRALRDRGGGEVRCLGWAALGHVCCGCTVHHDGRRRVYALLATTLSAVRGVLCSRVLLGAFEECASPTRRCARSGLRRQCSVEHRAVRCSTDRRSGSLVQIALYPTRRPRDRGGQATGRYSLGAL